MRMRRTENEEAEVAMSPLIDCVFLLLIFFLVTSMIKRSERQIPVTLADPTAAVSETDHDDVFRVGIDEAGHHFAQAGRDRYGKMSFAPIADLPTYLRDLAAQRGPDRPVELVVERDTPFQTVIDTLDVFELQGFDNVRSRVRPGGIEGGN